jgi:hypothetical protein
LKELTIESLYRYLLATKESIETSVEKTKKGPEFEALRGQWIMAQMIIDHFALKPESAEARVCHEYEIYGLGSEIHGLGERLNNLDARMEHCHKWVSAEADFGTNDKPKEEWKKLEDELEGGLSYIAEIQGNLPAIRTLIVRCLKEREEGSSLPDDERWIKKEIALIRKLLYHHERALIEAESLDPDKAGEFCRFCGAEDPLDRNDVDSSGG